MRDIDTAVVDSLKVLDPKRPIREADMRCAVSLRSMLPVGPMQRRMSAFGPKRTLVGFGRGSILRGVAAPGDRSNSRNGLGVKTLNLLNIEMIYIGIRMKVDIGE